jgi:hypothetical protein
MNSSALIIMLTVQITVTIITAYFFYKVLTAPKRSEPDSYSNNDIVD